MDIGAYELRCSNQNIVNIIEEITLSVADYTKNNKIIKSCFFSSSFGKAIKKNK